MHEDFNDTYSGYHKGNCKTCGGIIKMAKEYSIRDKVYYVRFFNKKHIKSDERMVIANSTDDAMRRVMLSSEELPKHHTLEISEYFGDNNPISEE